MKYKLYIQSIVTENIIVEANSQREAFELAAVHDSRTSNIIRFAMVDADGFVQQTLFPRFDWSSIRPSVPCSGTEQECIAHHFRLQLIKSLALTELIADLDTTRDLAVERNESDCEVLMTRDFVDEYDAFMQVIRTARAALDLPDQKYADADALSTEGGDDCDENHEEYPGPRLDGQYPSKFYERVPDWNAEAANIAKPEGDHP